MPLPEAIAAERSYECLIQPSMTVRVGAPVTGVVVAVNIERGDWVEAGTVIAQLESKIQETSLRLAEVRARSEAERKAAEARVAHLERKLRRNRSLKSREFVADASVEEVETELEIARSEVLKAKANMEVAAVEVDAAKAQLERRIVRSPIDGFVVERNLAPGEYWGEEKEVATIAAVDPLYVETFVDIAAHGTITVGTNATVRPEPPVGGAYNATVTVIDRVYDAASGTFRVRLELANPDYVVPAGINCEVTFDAAS